MTEKTCQTRMVGPLIYLQMNAGAAEDLTTNIEYRPEQYGAPDGARIVPSTVILQYTVHRGTAYVQNVNITESAIDFEVYTQALSGLPFTGTDGAITVSTSFQWHFND
jgi:hypothetical protein